MAEAFKEMLGLALTGVGAVGDQPAIGTQLTPLAVAVAQTARSVAIIETATCRRTSEGLPGTGSKLGL